MIFIQSYVPIISLCRRPLLDPVPKDNFELFVIRCFFIRPFPIASKLSRNFYFKALFQVKSPYLFFSKFQIWHGFKKVLIACNNTSWNFIIFVKIDKPPKFQLRLNFLLPWLWSEPVIFCRKPPKKLLLTICKLWFSHTASTSTSIRNYSCQLCPPLTLIVWCARKVIVLKWPVV